MRQAGLLLVPNPWNAVVRGDQGETIGRGFLHVYLPVVCIGRVPNPVKDTKRLGDRMWNFLKLYPTATDLEKLNAFYTWPHTMQQADSSHDSCFWKSFGAVLFWARCLSETKWSLCMATTLEMIFSVQGWRGDGRESLEVPNQWFYLVELWTLYTYLFTPF
jgi:hypothetical protein